MIRSLLLAPSAIILTLAPLTAAERYDRLYVFGDSYSDTGAGYIDGNGPTAVAYFAQRMNIPFTHSLDPHANTQGINFAVSGARTGEGEGDYVGTAFMHVGLMNQVRDFLRRVDTHALTFDPDRTLFFFAGGLNDRRLAPEETVANLTAEIELLRQRGAQHFTIALLPTRIPDFAAQGARLNPALRRLVTDLQAKQLDVTLNHWGEHFDHVLQHASTYGFTHTTDACAGRAIFNEDTTPRGDPEKFYYYHAGHPSTAVHRLVGDRLHAELSAPEPSPR